MQLRCIGPLKYPVLTRVNFSVRQMLRVGFSGCPSVVGINGNNLSIAEIQEWAGYPGVTPSHQLFR